MLILHSPSCDFSRTQTNCLQNWPYEQKHPSEGESERLFIGDVYIKIILVVFVMLENIRGKKINNSTRSVGVLIFGLFTPIWSERENEKCV